jgi:thioredoxin reductase
VEGVDGAFVVRAASPAGEVTVAGARVLLAIGRRGTPRALPAVVAPEASGRVLYALSDARAWAGRRVLVVGLGDSAQEAVVALARQPGTTVTVSYRGADFARGSARNVAAVRRLVEAGRVRVLFATRVARVDARTARIEPLAGAERRADGAVGEGGEDVAVDGVLALLGGEPSRALLAAAGVRCTAASSLRR